jgi:hypothetical protein
MSMQMDACLKKEQIGTFFVWVGALEGEFGGGWGPSGVSTKKVYVSSIKIKKHLPAIMLNMLLCPVRMPKLD